jgi:hypothetical protein
MGPRPEPNRSAADLMVLAATAAVVAWIAWVATFVG